RQRQAGAHSALRIDVQFDGWPATGIHTRSCDLSSARTRHAGDEGQVTSERTDWRFPCSARRVNRDFLRKIRDRRAAELHVPRDAERLYVPPAERSVAPMVPVPADIRRARRRLQLSERDAVDAAVGASEGQLRAVTQQSTPTALSSVIDD